MPKYGAFTNATEKALAVTGALEGRGGFSNVTGSFDDMGISYGVFQWNLGKKTLQPMLLTMFNEAPEHFRQCFSQPVAQYGGKVMDLTADIIRVCNMAPADAVKWAEERQDDKHRLQAHWVAAFKALGEVPAFRKIQMRFAHYYLDLAKKYMAKFGFQSERAYCFFVDVCVQMGSITTGSMARYKAMVKPGMSEEEKLVCLAKALPGQCGKDGDPKWEWIRRDVLSRKMMIAKGGGVCHSTPFNLETDFGVTMAKAVYA